MGKTGRPTEWGQAFRIGAEITNMIRESSHVRYAILCGSVRRTAEMVSDVDIAVELVDDSNDFSILSGDAPQIRWTPKGGTADIDNVVIEVYRSPQDCMGAAIQFLTGPGDLNVYLRMRAKRKGMRLSQYGLISLETAERIDLTTGDPFEDERRIFELLGVDYLEPADRTMWRQAYGR